tara:strand:- start:63 stop:272 length:210 start_codon:yes stop_codon:yes gene_type:complete
MDITLQDIQILKNIIDASSQRGLFKGAELKVVGDIYNKLQIVLEKAKQVDTSTKENSENSENSENVKSV